MNYNQQPHYPSRHYYSYHCHKKKPLQLPQQPSDTITPTIATTSHHYNSRYHHQTLIQLLLISVTTITATVATSKKHYRYCCHQQPLLQLLLTPVTTITVTVTTSSHHYNSRCHQQPPLQLPFATSSQEKQPPPPLHPQTDANCFVGSQEPYIYTWRSGQWAARFIRSRVPRALAFIYLNSTRTKIKNQ